jgi:uncharacterized protein (UPF0333 family)
MFNNKFNKKAQAAIEFLMTYGWMLLVVLIVGALVFSFVDFGSLLPNKVDISTQSIKGDSANSAAYGSGADANKVYIAFLYNGGQKATIGVADLVLTTTLGSSCYAMNVKNERLNSEQNVTRNVTSGAILTTTGDDVNFLSGHPGLITYSCNVSSSGLGELLSQDIVEGTVSVGVKDATRGAGARSIPNSGGFRLSIQ